MSRQQVKDSIPLVIKDSERIDWVRKEREIFGLKKRSFEEQNGRYESSKYGGNG